MIGHPFASRLIVLTACLGLFSCFGIVNAEQAVSPRRIGVLIAASWPGDMAQAFRHQLLQAGWSEGTNVAIEWRAAHGNYDQLGQLVSELVQHKVDVIVTDGTPATQTAKRSTSTIPIVMVHVADPLSAHLVASLAQPGGNVTGFSLMVSELAVKRLQLLKEAIPEITRVAVMWNPDTAIHPKIIKELQAIAPSLSIELNFMSVRSRKQIDEAFLAGKRAHAEAWYVLDDGFFYNSRKLLLNLASKYYLPLTYGAKEFAEDGALMVYGEDLIDSVRRAAGYVDKILKGAKPGDLPVEQPTKLVLVVNLKTAKALGITIPESILLRADEVIR